ncbi:MAG: MutS-related protein, partial [Terriglobales bacterium]
AQAAPIATAAEAAAAIDVALGFALLAREENYVRPLIDSSLAFDIKAGRHPVVEQALRKSAAGRFAPNDCRLAEDGTPELWLVTGPNMAGKSTFLRQNALIVLLAQMGAFVPAASAQIGVVDRLFSRVGAADDLARGRSTFMVEMMETAAILNTATPRSLVLLDEIGRGTSTYDGLAIAWAAIEYIHARTRAKTLFATHYHELTELAERLSGVKNFHVSVKESAGGIVFLRKVEPGPADKSYGIEVAKLAGLPMDVVVRAREVLAEHESAEHQVTDHLAVERPASAPAAQITLFTPLTQKIVERIREADVDRLTPLEALNLLSQLKKELE